MKLDWNWFSYWDKFKRDYVRFYPDQLPLCHDSEDY